MLFLPQPTFIELSPQSAFGTITIKQLPTTVSLLL